MQMADTIDMLGSHGMTCWKCGARSGPGAFQMVDRRALMFIDHKGLRAVSKVARKSEFGFEPMSESE